MVCMVVVFDDTSNNISNDMFFICGNRCTSIMDYMCGFFQETILRGYKKENEQQRMLRGSPKLHKGAKGQY